jgi:DMSO/TMAO reductase YedYZ heme-binding membrane subunit
MLNEIPLNATTSMSTNLEGAPSWFSIFILVGLAAVLIMILTMALSSFQRYKKLKGFLGWLVHTITYFFTGVGGLFAISIPGGIFYYFISQAGKGNTVPLWITFSIIGGYFGVAGLGYLFQHYIINRVKKFEKDLNKGKKGESKPKHEIYTQPSY